jgi:hypothetical protein
MCERDGGSACGDPSDDSAGIEPRCPRLDEINHTYRLRAFVAQKQPAIVRGGVRIEAAGRGRVVQVTENSVRGAGDQAGSIKERDAIVAGYSRPSTKGGVGRTPRHVSGGADVARTVRAATVNVVGRVTRVGREPSRRSTQFQLRQHNVSESNRRTRRACGADIYAVLRRVRAAPASA